MTVPPGDQDLHTVRPDVNGTTSPPPNVDPAHEATRLSSPGASSQSPGSTTAAIMGTTRDTNVTVHTPAIAPHSGTPAPPTVTVTMEASATSSAAGHHGGGGAPTWGYVILVLIILAIVVLCVILYFLRKASKTYSFELQRPGPSSELHQPAGTFEPVYLDDLETPIPKDVASSEEPAATNGTSVKLQGLLDQGGDPQVQTNCGDRSPPTDDVMSSDDPADVTANPSSSVNPLLEPAGPEENQSNSNPFCPSGRFVEISLDDVAPWSDQLLSSPEAPSSVLPFSS